MLHVPAARRAAMESLFALDAALGDVVARATDPALARIKLAWWREQLEALDHGPAPAEPHLQDIARHVIPAGISGRALSDIEPGWAALCEAPVDDHIIAERGAVLFAAGARILGAPADQAIAQAGRLHALAAVARRGVPELNEAARRALAPVSGHRFAAPVRPLTGLAALAARDVRRGAPPEPEGGAGRALAMLAHRWTGRIPRG